MIVHKTRLARLGYGVLLLALLGATALYIVRSHERDFALTITVDTVGPIRHSAEVLLNGFFIGSVRSIRPLDDTYEQFEIVLGLTPAIDLAADSFIRLASGSPFENAKLELVPGTAEDRLTDGQAVRFEPAAPGLLDQLSALGPMADQVLAKVTAVLDGVERTLGDVRGLAADLRPTIRTVATTLDQIRGLVGRAAATNGDPAPPPGTVAALLGSADGVVAQLTGLVARLDAALAALDLGGRGDALLGGAEQVMASATRLAATAETAGGEATGAIRAATELITTSQGRAVALSDRAERVLATLGTDLPNLLAGLAQLAYTLDRFMVDLRQTPNAILFGRSDGN